MSLGRDSFCKINENENKRKLNIDLAVVASQIPGGAIHDTDGQAYMLKVDHITVAIEGKSFIFSNDQIPQCL